MNKLKEMIEALKSIEKNSTEGLSRQATAKIIGIKITLEAVEEMIREHGEGECNHKNMTACLASMIDEIKQLKEGL